jgi:hypothetical protein
MVDTNALEELIQTRRAAADRIKRDVIKLQRDLQNITIELEAYEKALVLINPSAAAQQRLPLEFNEHDSSLGVKQRFSVRQPRTLSSRWKEILKTVASEFPEGFEYSDLLLVLEMRGEQASPNSARSQMMAYVNAGIAERISNGQFRITQHGLDQLGMQNKEAPAVSAEASLECGDVAERLNASDYESEEPNTDTGVQAKAVQGSVGSNPTVSAPFRRELLSSSSANPIVKPPVFPARK